jgi:hypothetical protein
MVDDVRSDQAVQGALVSRADRGNDRRIRATKGVVVHPPIVLDRWCARSNEHP